MRTRRFAHSLAFGETKECLPLTPLSAVGAQLRWLLLCSLLPLNAEHFSFAPPFQTSETKLTFEDAELYCIDLAGKVTWFAIGVNIEDIDLVPANQNFFGVNFGTGYILGAEDLKLLGASSQRMVPATSNLFREKPSVHFHISSCLLD